MTMVIDFASYRKNPQSQGTRGPRPKPKSSGSPVPRGTSPKDGGRVYVTLVHGLRLWVYGGCTDETLRRELLVALQNRQDSRVTCDKSVYDEWFASSGLAK